MLRFIYKKTLDFLPPYLRISLQYFRIFKQFPNLTKPTTINEKILKRILHEKDPNFAFYADKHAVRSYIAETLGGEYLVPLIAVYKDAKDIVTLNEWENIVIKPNHGAGMVKIIENEPDKYEKQLLVQLCEKWLSKDFSQVCDEWHYSLIPPMLVVERKITDPDENLRDYKFHRFLQSDGHFKQVLQVVAERSEHGYETVFFDVNHLDEILHSPFGYQLTLSDMEKKAIKQILDLNEYLCVAYSYVRLDWYITRKKIYFGEITFTPGAGRSQSFAGQFGVEMGKLWEVQ
ncbi:ATP-grasp fold amidoligase family protein [Acinetobacter indicus]|uniref:ATP-grasp fold amidoligase family protein n=1 Tax=Acinetobacter indicus TaxID=756892 RepID=UPI000CEC2623|nr:ATP-grasp fold amidoligase family protein [Acinetobacter indicus]